MSRYVCPKCGNTGKVDGKKCSLCKGKGVVDEGVILRHSKRPKRDVRKYKIEDGTM